MNISYNDMDVLRRESLSGKTY